MAKAIPQAEPGINMEALFESLGFEPHSPAQWEYCRSDARFNVPCCGRRWGKSISAGHRMTFKSFVPNSYNWIVGPTYALGEKEFRIVYQDYNKLGILKHCRKSYSVGQGNMRIETPWGSVIEVKSAEKPDGLLGEGLSHVIMSEAAKHSRETWEQYIEPALSDLMGTADFPSTPQGYNWYHGLWLLGQSDFSKLGKSKSVALKATNPNAPSHTVGSSSGGPRDYRSWSFPTWTNPVRYPGGLENAEIKRLKQNTSRVYFDQEYGAMFTAMTGAIYEEYDEMLHVKEHKFVPGWQNYLAFDYGFTNPFVCLDIQISPSDEVYVWREYYVRHVSTYDHAKILRDREQPAGYHVDGSWGDPRGPDEAATLSQFIGHVASQDVPWKLGVEMIKQLLLTDVRDKPRIFIDPSCTNLRRQLSQLHVKDSTRRQQDLNEMQGDGNIQHKVDDHAADALRYFVGPMFVLGMNTHLEDVYGNTYRGSESEDFLRVHDHMVLDTSITL